jgi:membrane-bound metal-dependent hydrolase YbcI (DUF457 family)
MDIVHHALIGGAVCLTATAHGHELAGIAFLAASVFPDLDVFFMLLGKRFYLTHHQSVTHSLILAPLYGLLIAAVLAALLGWETLGPLFLGAWAGLAVHILLDWSNTFRISLLLPLRSNRYSLDAVFFVDSVAWTLTALFYLFYLLDGPQSYWFLYPLLFAGYFGLKWRLHHHIVKRLKPIHAIPSSLNPFEFFILEEDGQAFTGYLYNALTRAKRRKRTYPAAPAKSRQLASQSQVFNDMRHILRALHITDVAVDDNGTTITAEDIAVRNFGGRFGRTVVRFDKEDRLVDESANI